MSNWKNHWYAFLQLLSRLSVVLFFRIRHSGQHHLPREGGALLLSNHQSYFDPVLLGVATRRPLTYLARKGLFGFGPFRWLIESLNAIPIDRDAGGREGLKQTLERLKRAEIVVVFPEGTRTPDGEVQPLKPGFAVLARRAGVPVVPAAIEGAYACWPRRQKLPGPGVIQVHFGTPLSPEELKAYDSRQLVAEVERRIRACHAEARRQRQQRGAV